MSTPTHSAGRTWKLMGFLLLALGVVASMFASSSHPVGLGSIIGFGSMALGSIVFLIGRFMD